MRHLTCSFAGLMLVQAVATAVACADPDPDALWRIVHDQCVPDQLNNLDPAPCVEVDLSAGPERGYAVLKDSDGRDQFLLIPTARLTGIEDPALRDPGAPDYFEYAWQARALAESAAGGTLPRDWIGLAVNSLPARTQDQLHIHIDCLRADVHQALADAAGSIGSAWSPLPVPLAGDRYEALAVSDLNSVNPFTLALAGAPDPTLATVVVVGSGTEDQPGFVLLRRWAEPGSADPAAGENLQDHQACPAPVPPGPFTAK